MTGEFTQALGADSNIVLVVDLSGAVVQVIEAPEDGLSSADAEHPRIDDLWRGPLATAIGEHVKRAIRIRKVQSGKALQDAREHEFICVPQGRDRVLLVVRDVSDSADAMARIRQLAYTDEVTGLPNRECLLKELGKIADVQRLREGRAAVLCIHVDMLDEHANALVAGTEDELLRELASRLATQLRGMNDESQEDYDRYSVLARTDFRQFTVVLPEIGTGEDAESVMLRLLEVLSRPLAILGRDLCARPSGGVALFPQDGRDAESLYRNALAAVQDARNSEMESFRFHSGTVRVRNLQRQDLTADLRSALHGEKFAINYLPVVDARSGVTRSIEALLRWPETVLGSQSTRKIIAIAEYTGLIADIGEWVMRRSCEQLRAWRESGHEDLRVSINLSNQEFVATDIVPRIENVLNDTGVDPAAIELEIKEHMVVRDATEGHATCKALKSLGVGVVIDDYGTESCTLAHLSQSPADAIKIDLSFVANIVSSERDRAACSAAVAMAHGLGMQVIAEGVETDQQAQFLRDAGCDFLQGFLFARPLDADAVSAWLDASAGDELSRCRAS